MDILFLDANVLFSAAYTANARLLKLWQLPHVKLMTSTYAAEEARRNLKQLQQQERLAQLLKTVNVTTYEQTDKILPKSIILPAKDRPILAAAIISKATFLITGDFKDFGPYYGQNLLGVTILPPAKYLEVN